MRFLVIQTAFVGDCVLSLPFLRRLGDRHPEAFIDIVANGPGVALFEAALKRGLADMAARTRVLAYDKRGRHRGWRAGYRFARSLRESGPAYDAAFCLQRSFRSGFLAVCAGALTRVGFSSGAASWLYTRLVRREWDTGKGEIEKNLDLLRAWSPEPIAAWPPRDAPSLLKAPLNLAAPAASGPPSEAPVLVSLGSPWATKRWPLENAAPLVERLTRAGTEVRLIGDAQAQPLAAALRQQVPSLLLKDLTGKTSIEAWIDEIQKARALISGDSAAVHVASDLNVSVIALFGPTLPEFGFAPWRPESWVLGVTNLPCRPCGIHGPKECPLGHHKCLRDISANDVHRHLARTLDRGAGRG